MLDGNGQLADFAIDRSTQ